MSHAQQLTFVSSVKDLHPTYFDKTKVLEVGSLNINGTVRQFFTDCDYLGIDVGPGKCVDLVCEGQAFDGDSDSFDVAISCECFEHNPYWKETFANMIRVVKSNGLIIMTCATTGRKEHGTSRTSPKDSPLSIKNGWEYYENLTELDFINGTDLTVFSSYSFSTNDTSKDLYFHGILN